MHVCNSNEPPEIPADLSPAGKDFILSCLKRNPSDRPNVYQLLRHPFVKDGFDDELKETPTQKPQSTDFNSGSTGYASVSPIIKEPISSPNSVASETNPDPLRGTDDYIESLNPYHTVEPPFKIEMASLNRQQEDKPDKVQEIALVLQRPSLSLSETDELDSLKGTEPYSGERKPQEPALVLRRPSLSGCEGSAVVFSVSESC
mmetsp:Transcript_3410/g.7078  ORF Transcript_3410/g.7078 Transcript_3410/m.7078 type:complete len:203 (+) Transcript_3410:886-1494(+)